MSENELNKEVESINRPWWQRQRSWAMLIGIAGTVCSFIPGAQVASAPLLAVAGLLGFNGMSAAVTRTEKVAVANALKLAGK